MGPRLLNVELPLLTAATWFTLSLTTVVSLPWTLAVPALEMTCCSPARYHALSSSPYSTQFSLQQMMSTVRVLIYMLCRESVFCPVRISLVRHVFVYIWYRDHCILPNLVSPPVCVSRPRNCSYVLLCVSLTSNRIYCATAGKPLVECTKKLTSSLHDSALVVYECLLTIPAEVRLVCRRRWTALTVLFILNRYTLVANAIFSIWPYTYKVCF